MSYEQAKARLDAEAEQARKEKEAVARENRELRGKASRADEAEAANDQLMAALQKAETARDDIQNKLAETNRKLEEAEARGNTIETVEVEKIPDEVQEELERLRAEVEQAKAIRVLSENVQKALACLAE